MDNQVLQQILLAVEVTHNPTSNPIERKNAQDYLENFKVSNAINLGAYAIHMIAKEHSDVVRYFGFHLIEYMINNQWGVSLQAPQKLEVKNVLLNYAASGTKGIMEEKQFIKTKLCSLIVEVMKREWPQNMPDILDKVVQLASMGMTQSELSVMVISTLAQDVSSDFSSDMDVERKKEVIEGLKKFLDPVFGFLFNMFDSRYKDYTNASNNEVRSMNEKILNELLQTSVSLINDWISPNVFFQHNFINIWCYLISESNLKETAAECLLLFTNRKWADTGIEVNNIVNFLNVFCTKCVEIMRKIDDDTILDDYTFHKTLAKIVGGFGSTNMHLLKKEHSQFAEIFYDLVLEFTKYPSQVICGEVTPVWAVAFEPKKEEVAIAFTSEPFFDKYYAPLLEACSNKMLREIGNPDNEAFSEAMMNQTSSLEFQDKNEYTQYFGSFRSKLTHIVKSIADKKPDDCLLFVARGIEGVLKRNAPAPNDKRTPTGLLDISSHTYVIWEGASTMLEWVIQGIAFNKMKPDNQCFKVLETLLQMLLSFQTKDPLIQARYLHSIQVLTPLYKFNHAALDATLNHLFMQMQFRLDNEVNISLYNISEDSQAARRKAFAVFINLCNSHSGYLLPSIDKLVNNAGVLWSEKKISSPELIMLYEAFVVISNEWKSYDKQFQFLVFLLNSLKEEWKSKPFCEVAGSEELLLKCLGAVEEPDEQRRNAFREMRDKILHILSMFKSVAKRMPNNPQHMGLVQRVQRPSGGTQSVVKYPIAPFLVELLPNVMAMIRTLHSIYRPEVQNLIPIEKRNPLFHVGIDEKQTMLKQVFVASKLSEYDYYLYTTHRNIRRLRAYCYELLGQACKYCDVQQFWGNPQLFNLLSSSVFSFLEHIDNKDLKALLGSFVSPFAAHCPKNLYNSLLANILSSLYQLIYSRLDVGWTQIIQITKGQFDAMTSASEEVIQEHIMRELTGEVIDSPLALTKSLSKTKDNKNPQPDNITEFILENESVIGIMLMISVRLMTIPDTVAVHKAVLFVQRVIPHLVDKRKLYPIIGGELLQTAITALMIFKQDMHQTIMNLIADIYFYFSRRCPFPEQVFTQIPNVKPNQIKTLNQCIAGKKKDEKKFRMSMRDFLKRIAGTSSGEFGKRKTIIRLGQPKARKDNTNLSFLDAITLESVADLFK